MTSQVGLCRYNGLKSNTNSSKPSAMPRFLNAHVIFIKRTMLPRVPACLFCKDDIELIAAETGLDHAQIQQWGKNFRLRYTPEEREKVLCDYTPEQVLLVLPAITLSLRSSHFLPVFGG